MDSLEREYQMTSKFPEANSIAEIKKLTSLKQNEFLCNHCSDSYHEISNSYEKEVFQHLNKQLAKKFHQNDIHYTPNENHCSIHSKSSINRKLKRNSDSSLIKRRFTRSFSLFRVTKKTSSFCKSSRSKFK